MWCILVKELRFPSYATSELNAKGASHFLRLGVIDSWMHLLKTINQKMANTNLANAKTAKNDEFYTQYPDIQKEINAYLDYDPNVFRGKTVLLPQVTGAASMVLRKYTGKDSLREGAYGIMEPTGALFTDYDCIDVAIVPGMAFMGFPLEAVKSESVRTTLMRAALKR